EHTVGELAVGVVEQVERLDDAGEPALEPGALAHQVVERLVVAPDPAALVDHELLALELAEHPAAVTRLDLGRRMDLDAVEEQAQAVAARVEIDQRRREAA